MLFSFFVIKKLTSEQNYKNMFNTTDRTSTDKVNDLNFKSALASESLVYM